MLRSSRLLLSLYKPTTTTILRILSSSSPPHFRHFSRSTFEQQQPPTIQGDKIVAELLAQVEREKQQEREQKKKVGIEVKEEEEEEEDYMGVGPLIERLEKRKKKEMEVAYWEPTDSESEDERWTPEEIKKMEDDAEKKSKRHKELLNNFANAETLDDAYEWMTRINQFEERFMKLPLEYRVIGCLMNRLKEATGKDRFILLQKINRAVKLMEVKEAYDPNNPANYGIIEHQLVGSPEDLVNARDFQRDKAMMKGVSFDDDDEDFDETKERDEALLEKMNEIDMKMDQKWEEYENTFGKKRRVLKEELDNLAEERSSLTEKKKRPLYCKGFDVKVIDVKRTVKVTKGDPLVKYTALLATGNYHGVVGYAKAKGVNAQIAIFKAYQKCFQNLHSVERHEEHTIAHAIHTKYGKTKLYLWPGPIGSGLVAAGKTVETILYLAGFSNVKSKIIGSRNPLNIVKAVFQALNAIETPKDVQEKFGRTVVEKYLLSDEQMNASDRSVST